MIAESRLVRMSNSFSDSDTKNGTSRGCVKSTRKNFTKSLYTATPQAVLAFGRTQSSSIRKKKTDRAKAQKGAVMMRNRIHSDQEPSARDFNLLAAVISQPLHSPATITTNQIGGFSRSLTGYCSLFPTDHFGGTYVFRFRQRKGRRFLQPAA